MTYTNGGISQYMLHDTISDIIYFRGKNLSQHLGADLLAYVGEINSLYIKDFRNSVERLKANKDSYPRLLFMLTTPGGVVETTEEMVNIIRHHYSEVIFIVPDYAQSAGTILCMSGDKLYMDYSSALGPIDPQIPVSENDGTQRLVPALGYLDKVEELVKKSENNTITNAEFVVLQNQDLGKLRSYEQARDLSVELLKDWLVRYKFRTWTKHQSNPDKIGQDVTDHEKAERAEEIAKMLGDNKLWHSHGRRIGMQTLRDMLRLEIEDYSHDSTLRDLVRSYHDLLFDHVTQRRYGCYIDTAIGVGGAS